MVAPGAGQSSSRSAAAAGPSDARARVALGPAVGDERVDVIVDLMATGRWCRAERRRLATEWGLSESTVKGYAVEAGRRIRQATDADEIVEQTAATIGRLDRLSFGAEEAGEHRAAIAAEEVKAKVLGLVRSDVRRETLVMVLGVKATPSEAIGMLERAVAFLAAHHPTVAAELGEHLAQEVEADG